MIYAKTDWFRIEKYGSNAYQVFRRDLHSGIEVPFEHEDVWGANTVKMIDLMWFQIQEGKK